MGFDFLFKVEKIQFKLKVPYLRDFVIKIIRVLLKSNSYKIQLNVECEVFDK